jgi:hypothetical protein
LNKSDKTGNIRWKTQTKEILSITENFKLSD